MQYFFDIIKSCIVENGFANICEIGSSHGWSADRLLSIDGVKLSVIDPCIDEDLCEKYKDNVRVHVYKGLSHDMLTRISKQDCILIDGDHNWYTVFNELSIIHERNLLRSGGIIFFHDVGWPYARRDMYYLPESIPPGYRHPYAKKGIVRGEAELSENDTFNSFLNNALIEGGLRNGVLTAIEDFLKKINDKRYYFIIYKKEYGLGILIKKKDIFTLIKYYKYLLRIRYLELRAKLSDFVKTNFPVVHKLLKFIIRETF